MSAAQRSNLALGERHRRSHPDREPGCRPARSNMWLMGSTERTSVSTRDRDGLDDGVERMDQVAVGHDHRQRDAVGADGVGDGRHLVWRADASPGAVPVGSRTVRRRSAFDRVAAGQRGEARDGPAPASVVEQDHRPGQCVCGPCLDSEPVEEPGILDEEEAWHRRAWTMPAIRAGGSPGYSGQVTAPSARQARSATSHSGRERLRMMTRSPDRRPASRRADRDGGDAVPHLGVRPARPALRRLPAEGLLAGISFDTAVDELDHAAAEADPGRWPAPRRARWSWPAPRSPAHPLAPGRPARPTQARAERGRCQVKGHAQGDRRGARHEEHEAEFRVQPQREGDDQRRDHAPSPGGG